MSKSASIYVPEISAYEARSCLFLGDLWVYGIWGAGLVCVVRDGGKVGGVMVGCMGVHRAVEGGRGCSCTLRETLTT